MILIIQNGYFIPGITKYLKEDYLIVKSFENTVNDAINLDNYSIIIILGGNQSLLNIQAFPYLHDVIKLINKCFRINKPLLGICLGSQLITYALGCEMKSCSKNNIGYDTTILGYQNVFRYHIDYIIPNHLITVLEYFENMPYFYKHGTNVYGVQCHPDIIPESIQNYTTDTTIIEYAHKNKEVINKNNAVIIEKLLSFVRKN